MTDLVDFFEIPPKKMTSLGDLVGHVTPALYECNNVISSKRDHGTDYVNEQNNRADGERVAKGDRYERSEHRPS